MNIDAKNLTKAIENQIDRSKWERWKFSDLVDNIVEKVVPKESGLEHYIGLEHLDTGSLKIRRLGETGSLAGDKLKIYEGDLIFAKRNAYLKRVAIAEFDAVASAHSLVLRPKKENVLPEFFPFFMMSETFWQRAIEISVGSLSPTINWKVLAKQEFLLPPKEQQAKLAELLWSMEEVIEKELALYSLQKKVLPVYFENQIKKDMKNRAILKDVLVNIFAGKSPKAESRPANESENGVLKVSAVGDGEYVESENKALIKQDDYNLDYEVKKGFILVTRANANPSGIGRPCFVTKTRPGLMLSDKTLRLIPKTEKINDRFLFQLLRTRMYRAYVESVAGGTEAKNISQALLMNSPIWNPPIKVQEQVETVLYSFDKAIDAAKEAVSSSKSLQKSLINQVF